MSSFKGEANASADTGEELGCLGNKLLGEQNSRLHRECGELRLERDSLRSELDAAREKSAGQIIDIENAFERAEKAEAERDELFRKWSASKSNREKDLEAKLAFVVDALEFLAKNEGVTAVGIYARGKLKDMQALKGEGDD